MLEQQIKPCIYHRIQLGYEVGLGKIYSQEEIERAKQSPSFEREYNLKYSGLIGNVFSQTMIDNALELGERYKAIPFNYDLRYFAGIDPGFSKTTPIYIGEINLEHQCVRIVYCKRYDRAAPATIIDDMWKLHTQFLNLHWFIDSSNSGFIKDIQLQFDEPQTWQKADDVHKNAGYRIHPVNFGNKEHEHLLEHTHSLLSRGMLAIPKEYEFLITSLRTAQATEWNLDKESTVYDDDLDSLRCLLKEVIIK